MHRVELLPRIFQAPGGNSSEAWDDETTFFGFMEHVSEWFAGGGEQKNDKS